MGVEAEGKRKAPRTTTVTDTSLDVMRQGWLKAMEVVLLNLASKHYCPANLFYRQTKRIRDHYEALSWDSLESCRNGRWQTDPFGQPLPPPLCKAATPFLPPYAVWRPQGIIWWQGGRPFLPGFSALGNRAYISETWPPLCRNKSLRSHRLFPFSSCLLWIRKTDTKTSSKESL